MLSIPDLQKLADWEPIAPGFGRLEPDAYKTKAQPIFQTIEKLASAKIRIMKNGGLSNYASAFIHNSKSDSGKIKGLYVYLSLLAPIAAMGRDTAYFSSNSFASNMTEPNAILQAGDLESEFERDILRAIEAGGFRLLSKEEATTALPEGVTPYEYCLNDEPWDLVFHVLFSDTD
jgi:hypothetical protein